MFDSTNSKLKYNSIIPFSLFKSIQNFSLYILKLRLLVPLIYKISDFGSTVQIKELTIQ